MVKGRGKDAEFGATATTYIYQVAGERSLSIDMVNDDYAFEEYREMNDISSKAMRWGVENEPFARLLYERTTGNTVKEVGLVPHPEVENFAASPDGLTFEKGVLGCIEIKCVNNVNYMRYRAVRDGASLKVIEPRYYWQIQAEMACTDAQWCDFIVYHPFMKKPLLIIRIERNEHDINVMLQRVKAADKAAKELINI